MLGYKENPENSTVKRMWGPGEKTQDKDKERGLNVNQTNKGVRCRWSDTGHPVSKK